MKVYILLLTILFSLCCPFVNAQDFSRFMEVDEWSINYSIVIDQVTVVPKDLIPETQKILEETGMDFIEFDEDDFRSDVFTFIDNMYTVFLIEWAVSMSNLEVFSVGFEKSVVIGNLVFDSRDGYSSWTGDGKVIYNINAVSQGAISGSTFYGTMQGEGSTTLCSDESYFSIRPGYGTYELYLIPGDGDQSGMIVEVYSDNSVWDDITRQVSERLGNESVMALKKELADELKETYKPEKDDLFYNTDPEKWIVDIEGYKLPEKGMIIKGKKEIREGHTVYWRIEPAR